MLIVGFRNAAVRRLRQGSLPSSLKVPSFAQRVWVHRASQLRELSNTGHASDITPVEKIVLDHIKATGPMPFATYMQLCLSHPTEGYYMNPANPVFGAKGDFITSPEISQVFGELIAIWLLSQWMQAGQPKGVRLVELGPGRGTLMDDVLRVFSKFIHPQGTARYVHLVESSNTMRKMQENKLRLPAQRAGWELVWHHSIDQLRRSSEEYTMLIAHEFFDALPVHIVERTEKGWQELLVTAARDSNVSTPESDSEQSLPSHTREQSGSHLKFVLSPTPTPASTLLGLSSLRFRSLPVGSRIEVSPTAFKIARKVGELVSTSRSNSESGQKVGGSALVIDYGAEKVFGNSLRAFKEHKVVDVFERPGRCDITANVDFAYLKEAFSDIATPLGPLSQAEFLRRMGIDVRVSALLKVAVLEERKQSIRQAAERLVDMSGMGREYQVLGITCRSDNAWPFVSEAPSTRD